MIDNWIKEHSFWAGKVNSAFIRFNMANKSGDKEAEKIALRQLELYRRRMKSVVPPEVKARWDANKNESIKRALEEIL